MDWIHLLLLTLMTLWVHAQIGTTVSPNQPSLPLAPRPPTRPPPPAPRPFLPPPPIPQPPPQQPPEPPIVIPPGHYLHSIIAEFATIPLFGTVTVKVAPQQPNPATEHMLIGINVHGVVPGDGWTLNIRNNFISTVDNTCVEAPLFDPSGRMANNATYRCNRTDVTTCAVGDLTGKFGMIVGTSTGKLRVNLTDTTMRLVGVDKVTFHTLELRHLRGNGTLLRSYCARLEPVYVPFPTVEREVHSASVRHVPSMAILVVVLLWTRLQ